MFYNRLSPNMLWVRKPNGNFYYGTGDRNSDTVKLLYCQDEFWYKFAKNLVSWHKKPVFARLRPDKPACRMLFFRLRCQLWRDSLKVSLCGVVRVSDPLEADNCNHRHRVLAVRHLSAPACACPHADRCDAQAGMRKIHR